MKLKTFAVRRIRTLEDKFWNVSIIFLPVPEWARRETGGLYSRILDQPGRRKIIWLRTTAVA